MKNLNVYLADLSIGYIKLHNLHWNVKGMAFKAVHEYLEVIYDEIAEFYDAYAELGMMSGCTPAASAKEYLAITTVEELPSKPYTVEEALQITVDYLKAMRASALEIRKAADETDAFELANMMEDHVASYSKHIWFIESTLAK